MSARPGTLWYWLSVGVAVGLVVVAILWNAWTFNQHRTAQRQLDALGLDPTAFAAADPAPGSAAAAELDLLLEADRRGILEDEFLALLSEPQKRALAQGRGERLADRAGARTTSLIVGGLLILGGAGAYWVGRRARRKSG